MKYVIDFFEYVHFTSFVGAGFNTEKGELMQGVFIMLNATTSLLSDSNIILRLLF